MNDVCFGYLDNRDGINFPIIRDKAKQLTRLSVTGWYQATPNHEAKSVDQLISWFMTQSTSGFMVVIKYGVTLDDKRIVDHAIADMTTHSSMVKGILKLIDGVWYLDDSFCVISREKLEALLVPSWGSVGVATNFLVSQEVSDYGSLDLLEYKDKTVVSKTTVSGGWGLVESSLRWSMPVCNMTDIDNACISDMEPTIGETALARALTDTAMMGSHPITYNQSMFLHRHSTRRCKNGQLIEIFDTEEPRLVLGETPMEIKNLYSVAAGFRPLKILLHHGFRDDTNVVYFDSSSQAIAFRKILVERWDGTNLPRFLEISRNDMGFEFHPNTFIAQNAWQDTLKTFGGPREFKSLWDRYRRLRHVYRHVDVISRHELCLGKFSPDPHSYIWWSNAFSSYSAHLDRELIELEIEFKLFIERIRNDNPNMILDGRNHLGRWCNHQMVSGINTCI